MIIFDKNKIRLITISTDSTNHLIKFREENGFNFTLISDRGAKMAKQFNVYTFGSIVDITYLKVKLAIPSEFLLNKNHQIAWRYIGKRTVRPSIEEIENGIKSLN
jgi:peroxiredoxin